MAWRFIFGSLDIEITKLIACSSYIGFRYCAVLKTSTLSKGITDSIFYSSDLEIIISCVDKFLAVLMS